MICPGCGKDNQEGIGQCVHCGYKFQFGHAFDDPSKMTFLNFTKKPILIRYVFASIFLIILVLVIFVWLKSI